MVGDIEVDAKSQSGKTNLDFLDQALQRHAEIALQRYHKQLTLENFRRDYNASPML